VDLVEIKRIEKI